ncbi:hypothetical protein G5714_000806 [Onychostoma macrolepis]|uniref:HECT domain-containing protein n=1 Tax=Onychostoma macrolepis TaxID=369639 RepID=A0A7J6DIC8_9TELE|nr:hypothetical protein G5714_000806 [Onychostoma macrolepis]
MAPRSYEFIYLTNQIPPLHNSIVQNLGDDDDDDKEDTVEWNEGEELEQTDEDQEVKITWNLNENIIQNSESNEAENEVPSPPSSYSNPALLMGSEMPSPPENLPSHSGNHLSPITSSENSENAKVVHALIHRVKVVEDLLAVFMDDSIIQSTLKMEFVNEKAVDDAGVSREVYTAFWDQFLEQCEGEDEQVPRLRPDFSEAEWEAVGRI